MTQSAKGMVRVLHEVGLHARPSVRLTQKGRLEPEVDCAGRDIEGEALRVEVVLGERHRERQGDPAAEPPGTAAEIAIDDRPGERSTGGVEAADAEHP